MFDVRPRERSGPQKAPHGLTCGAHGPGDAGALGQCLDPAGQDSQGGQPCGRTGLPGEARCPPRCPLPWPYLREEGVHVAGLEPELGVGRGVGGVAALLHLSEVLLRHVAFGQVEPVDERQDVPGGKSEADTRPGGAPGRRRRGRGRCGCRGARGPLTCGSSRRSVRWLGSR